MASKVIRIGQRRCGTWSDEGWFCKVTYRRKVEFRDDGSIRLVVEQKMIDEPDSEYIQVYSKVLCKQIVDAIREGV